jgi:hypothetical protein
VAVFVSQGQIHVEADLAGREHGCPGVTGTRTSELFLQADQVKDDYYHGEAPHTAVFGG